MSRKARKAGPGISAAKLKMRARYARLSRRKAAPTQSRSAQKKGALTKRPISRAAHNEFNQSNNASASALHSVMRFQSPFLIQLLSSIQVPPTHITLFSAM